MKFILFVEGHTEKETVANFLKRWIDNRLSRPVAIQPVRFNGWPEMIKEMVKKANMYLDGPQSSEIIAVVGLLDLYGPNIYPVDKTSANERYKWAVDYLEKQVKHQKFKMFFAVHELEAWLLSDPNMFPQNVADAVLDKTKKPEEVNFDEPPSKFLNRIYLQNTGRKYKKVVFGKALFSKLDPAIAYNKCPYLKSMLDVMLRLAKESGL